MTNERSRTLACGLDLGGTKLLGVVIDADAPDRSGSEILAEARVPTPHGDPEVLAGAMAELLEGLRRTARRSLGGDVVAVGVGAPGLVARDGTLRYGPNLPGILDFPFGRRLGEASGLPVAVDNDATCAAWGEYRRGASRGHNHTLMVTLGTGIGAGITVKGGVLRGHHGFAGEPGHMVVDPFGPPCPCGKRGCWERYGSGSGLGRLARDAAVANRIPDVVAIAGGLPQQVTGEHVTAAAAQGSPGATALLDEFGWWVALGLANLVGTLDSEIVVVGGGLAAAGDLVVGPIARAFPGLLFAADSRPEVPVVVAELGEHAGAIGAALLAADRRRTP